MIVSVLWLFLTGPWVGLPCRVGLCFVFLIKLIFFNLELMLICFVASDPGLHCLNMSHRKDTRHIYW